MSITLPKYQLTVPSETTQFKDLGKELRELGISIESVLESFDYNGADPSLVASRVAALEAWKPMSEASVTTVQTALDQALAKRQTGRIAYAAGGTSAPNSGWYWSDVKTVTFPRQFPAGSQPKVFLQAEEPGGLLFALLSSFPTAAGFTYRIMRLATYPLGGNLIWSAEI